MKSICPFSEMNIGDVREVSTYCSRKAVYSAAWEWAKKHPNEDGSRPKFSIKMQYSIYDIDLSEDSCELNHATYRIERTA